MQLLKTITFVGALAVCSGVASAQDASSTMQASYGNTTVVSDGNTTYNAYYDEDGTFKNSLGMHGTWELEGDALTLKSEGEVIGTTILPGGKSVGDTFEMSDEAGNTVTVTISAGRE